MTISSEYKKKTRWGARPRALPLYVLKTKRSQMQSSMTSIFAREISRGRGAAERRTHGLV